MPCPADLPPLFSTGRLATSSSYRPHRRVMPTLRDPNACRLAIPGPSPGDPYRQAVPPPLSTRYRLANTTHPELSRAAPTCPNSPWPPRRHQPRSSLAASCLTKPANACQSQPGHHRRDQPGLNDGPSHPQPGALRLRACPFRRVIPTPCRTPPTHHHGTPQNDWPPPPSAHPCAPTSHLHLVPCPVVTDWPHPPVLQPNRLLTSSPLPASPRRLPTPTQLSSFSR
jgi:hypothetical protein